MNTALLIRKIIFSFMKKMKRDRISASAAESAFFIIMGFVPFFLLLMSILQYTYITQDMVMAMMDEMLPESFYGVVASIVKDLFRKSTVLVSGSVITAIWATSRSVMAITSGLNAVREVKEDRNYFFMRLRSAIFIVFLAVAITISMVLLLIGNRFQEVLLEFIPVVGRFTGLIISLRMTTSFGIFAVIFLALYCALPNCHMSLLRQVPGALFTAFFWMGSSFVFSIYLEYFANLSIYGSLSAVIMLMLWLYFCMWSLFVGAEVNCFLEYPSAFLVDELKDSDA